MPSRTEKLSAPSSSTHEPDEDSSSAYMREQSEQGSRLAPFHWASLWKRGLIPGSVPQWVAVYLATLAADYYQGAQEAIRVGKKPTTLDELAGFSHVKTNVWKKAHRKNEAILLKYYFDSIVREAKSDWNGSGNLLIDENMFPDGESAPVPVLDGRGRPTCAFQVALGRWLSQRGFLSLHHATDDAAYRAFRRLLLEGRAAWQGDDADK